MQFSPFRKRTQVDKQDINKLYQGKSLTRTRVDDVRLNATVCHNLDLLDWHTVCVCVSHIYTIIHFSFLETTLIKSQTNSKTRNQLHEEETRRFIVIPI